MSKINGKKVSKKNQLHDFFNYDFDNLNFADAVEGSVPNSQPPVKFFRINILAQNEKYIEKEDKDGNITEEIEYTKPVYDEAGVLTEEPKMVMTDTMGDFLFTLDRAFSFGVSESSDPVTSLVTGHQISMCLYNKDGPTEREIKVVEKFELLIQKCKEHLLKVGKSIKKPRLEMSDLKNMDKLIYWKLDEEGERIPGVGPTISPKLIEFKASVDSKGVEKPYQMVTTFYLEDEVDDEGNPREVDPLTFLSDNKNKKFKLCYITPVIKIESIFIGAKISIQCKISEGDIAPVNAGVQKFLHGRQKTKESSKTIFLPKAKTSKHEDDDEEQKDERKSPRESVGELTDDVPAPAPKKKVVKKVKKSEVETE